MNRIETLFEQKQKGILSVFMTAGYPNMGDTIPILKGLNRAGVDMIEIGIPFSDPVADGPVIQQSSSMALANGMTIVLHFEQLRDIRKTIDIPLILMGYINPIMQFGFDDFCKKAEECGIDGLIIPDLPPDVYVGEWKKICEKYGLRMIFLITQQTQEARIRKIDEISEGYIYMVTSSGTTGGGIEGNERQIAYFEKVKAMNLRNPLIAGFGIRTKEDLEFVGNYSAGAIVGSHFIKTLGQEGDLSKKISDCIEALKLNNRIF